MPRPDQGQAWDPGEPLDWAHPREAPWTTLHWDFRSKQTWYVEFPGGPVVRTRHFHYQDARVQSLVGELRSRKLYSAAKKKKTKRGTFSGN